MMAGKEKGCSRSTEPRSLPDSGLISISLRPFLLGDQDVPGFFPTKVMLCPGTCADNPSVLMVATVMDTPAQAVAGGEEGLTAVTVDVVQEDVPRAVAEIGVALVVQGLATAHLLAHHTGVAQAPVVVTDGAPVPMVEDLHAALAGVGPTHQTDAAVTWRVTARREKGITFPRSSPHAPR